MLLLTSLVLVASAQAIAVPFSGVPVILDDTTVMKSHGVKLTANLDGVTGESTTVLRNATGEVKKVWVAIPRFALGEADPAFDVVAEMGLPEKSGSIGTWQTLSTAKAPKVAARIPLPDILGKGEVEWGETLRNQPLLTSLTIPANGTRPLRLRFTTNLGRVDYHANNGKDTGFRGAAYSMATNRPVELLSGSISCGSGMFVPIPQANFGFEIGTSGTAFRKQNADPSNMLMRLLLFAK